MTGRFRTLDQTVVTVVLSFSLLLRSRVTPRDLLLHPLSPRNTLLFLLPSLLSFSFPSLFSSSLCSASNTSCLFALETALPPSHTSQHKHQDQSCKSPLLGVLETPRFLGAGLSVVFGIFTVRPRCCWICIIVWSCWLHSPNLTRPSGYRENG